MGNEPNKYTIIDALWDKYGHYPIRLCRWMHECAVCEQTIRSGEFYFDGRYGKRAHVECADPENRAGMQIVEGA